MSQDHEAKLRTAAVKAGNQVISAWFHDEKFRKAYVPEPTHFVNDVQQVTAEYMRARGPEAGDGSMYLLELAKHEKVRKKGGYKTIEALIRGTPTAIDPWKAVEVLRVCFCTRQLRRMTQAALLDPIAGGDLGELQKRVSEALSASRVNEEKNAFSVRDAMDATVQGLSHAKEAIVSSTGLKYVDLATGQFRRQMSYLVGGESGIGKSSLTVFWVLLALTAKRRPMIVSAEDPLKLYGDRMVGLISAQKGVGTGINALDMRDGNSSPEDIKKILNIYDKYKDYTEPFFLKANGRPVEQVAGELASYIAAEKIDIVFVDYLQAFTTAENFGSNTRAKLNHVARTLYDVVKNGNAAGVFFSQLTIEPGKKASRDWIRDSKDLVNMSDIVLIGNYERETKPQKRSLKVEKVKNGPVGYDIDLTDRFDTHSACFHIDDELRAEAVAAELAAHLAGDGSVAEFDEWDRYNND